MRNNSIKETLVARGAVRSLEKLLPETWRVDLEKVDDGKGEALSFVGPNNQRIRFIVEIKRSGQPVGTVISGLRDRARFTETPVIYLSDYVGPSLRAELQAEGFSYVDATGWVRVVSDTPLILLTGQGAGKAPSGDRGSDISRLNGIAAGRIVRTLCEREGPLGVRELATIADISPGSVSKLLPTLVREGIIERDEGGRVVSVLRRSLISRWVQDYSFQKTNQQVGFYLAPRGVDHLLAQLSSAERPATLTGSAAARHYLPSGTTSVVPLRLIAVYCDEPELLANELGLVPTDVQAANVVIARPQDNTVLDATLAPVGLVLADLLTLPGRGNAEPEQLMDALARTDPAWRVR